MQLVEPNLQDMTPTVLLERTLGSPFQILCSLVLSLPLCCGASKMQAVASMNMCPPHAVVYTCIMHIHVDIHVCAQVCVYMYMHACECYVCTDQGENVASVARSWKFIFPPMSARPQPLLHPSRSRLVTILRLQVGTWCELHKNDSCDLHQLICADQEGFRLLSFDFSMTRSCTLMKHREINWNKKEIADPYAQSQKISEKSLTILH